MTDSRANDDSSTPQDEILRHTHADKDPGPVPAADDSVSEKEALPPSNEDSRPSPTEDLPSTLDHQRPSNDAIVQASLVTGGPDGREGDAAETFVGLSGRLFGDYELIEKIAHGGMGVVYKARQRSLNRTVALKMILSGQLASEEEVRRFYSEAEAAANLEHSGIVPIHEVGQHEGQHYFSMGFIEGQSLARRIADGPLRSDKAAELTKQVAEAIAYAHDRGVIHRDLKPANILLDREGQPRVTDFGLAKRIEGDSDLTATGQILGTPSYTPPEQASGSIHEIGPLSDVYSLGAILYCLLTGRPPFQAASHVETLKQVAEQEPASPRQLNATVPKDLETICLKCLEKDPGERYETAAKLADDLDRFLRDEPIHARPIGVVERLMRRSRKHRRMIISASIAIVATIVLITGGSLAWNWYSTSQLGGLTLTTTGDPLTAEVLDDRGEPVVEPFTVPTERPVELPHGTYRVRLSAPGQMSQTSQVTIRKDLTHVHQFRVDLTHQELWEPLTLGINDYYEVIDLAGRTDIVLFERRFGEVILRRLDGATLDSLWKMPLGNAAAQDSAEGPLPSGVDATLWQDLVSAWSLTGPRRAAPLNQYQPAPENVPMLVRPAPDIDGDAIGDLVFYWPGRADAPLLAISGADGKLVWLHSQQPNTHIVAEPLVTDVDADERGDVVVAYAQPNGQTWVEALSGTKHQPFWRSVFGSLPPAPAELRPPLLDPNDWRYSKEMPYSLQLHRTPDKSFAVLVTGRHVVAFDPASGESASRRGAAANCGRRQRRRVRTAGFHSGDWAVAA